jgi:hypothetical protein
MADENERRVEVVKPISITPKEYALNIEFAPLNEPLGALTIAFSSLESKLTQVINALLKVSHTDGIALEDLMQSINTRIRFFHTLATLKTKTILDEFLLLEVSKKSGLRSQLSKSNDYRNDYIHGPWTTFHDDGSFGKVRYRAVTGLHLMESVIKVKVTDVWKAHEYIFSTTLSLEGWRTIITMTIRLIGRNHGAPNTNNIRLIEVAFRIETTQNRQTRLNHSARYLNFIAGQASFSGISQ